MPLKDLLSAVAKDESALNAMFASNSFLRRDDCAECSYLQYCGCDPLFNYVTQKDHIGHRPTSDFCKKQKAIFKIIFNYLKENDEETINIFWSWINNTPHKEILE